MIIDTEAIKDRITDHCNRETQAIVDEAKLSKTVSTMGQKHFQDAKVATIEEVEKFEKFMKELDKTFPELHLIIC